MLMDVHPKQRVDLPAQVSVSFGLATVPVECADPRPRGSCAPASELGCLPRRAPHAAAGACRTAALRPAPQVRPVPRCVSRGWEGAAPISPLAFIAAHHGVARLHPAPARHWAVARYCRAAGFIRHETRIMRHIHHPPASVAIPTAAAAMAAASSGCAVCATGLKACASWGGRPVPPSSSSSTPSMKAGGRQPCR